MNSLLLSYLTRPYRKKNATYKSCVALLGYTRPQAFSRSANFFLVYIQILTMFICKPKKHFAEREKAYIGMSLALQCYAGLVSSGFPCIV